MSKRQTIFENPRPPPSPPTSTFEDLVPDDPFSSDLGARIQPPSRTSPKLPSSPLTPSKPLPTTPSKPSTKPLTAFPSIKRSTSLLQRLTRSLSDSRKAPPPPLLSTIPPPARQRSRTNPVQRKRVEEEEDQRYRDSWIERERAGRGYFDTRQRDISTGPSSPPRPLSVHPSGLSTFAVRGPLVPMQPKYKNAGLLMKMAQVEEELLRQEEEKEQEKKAKQ